MCHVLLLGVTVALVGGMLRFLDPGTRPDLGVGCTADLTTKA